MWKGVLKSRLGKASLFQAPSKMWNGVFINARQSKSVSSTLKTLGCTLPTQMNLVRVHMTTMDSIRKGKNMAGKVTPVKVSPVDGTEFQNMAEKVTRVIESSVDDAKVRLEMEVLKLKERISKLEGDLYRRPMSYETQLTGLEPMYDEVKQYVHSVQSARPSIIPSIGIPLNPEQRFSLPAEELGKGKTQSQITPLGEKLLKLVDEFSKLQEELEKLEDIEAEHPEIWGSDHEYGRKKMELLARVESLYDEAKSFEFSTQTSWESFLVSAILPECEFQLKKRSSCDPLGDKFLELSRIRDTYPKTFWRSLSFPVEPEYFLEEDILHEREKLVKELVPLLESVIPESPVDVNEVAFGAPSSEPGKSFDIVELLSRFSGDLTRNNGDQVALKLDTFKGKHVLVCCFHVPFLLNYRSSEIQILINLCNELYSTRDDFEMVMVARMNSLANYREVFDHFFSGFPELCLAVPFEDAQRRDYICNVIGLGCEHDFFECLLLNADGQVLPSLADCRPYVWYGAEGFPFTKDILYKRDLERKDMVFEKEGNWLDRVLQCNDSSPDFVYKFNPASSPQEKVPISQLSNKLKDKHVALYLCSGGEFIPQLLDMYEECREEQLDFEVVVVYMPFSRPLDPKVFQGEMDSLLKKDYVCDWWCLPFNNSVSMRFLHLTFFYEDYEDFYKCDKLIMVGPKVDHLDVYGARVMCHGIKAFPFTIDAAIKASMEEVRQITLESLFVDDEVSVFRGNKSSDSRKLGQLPQGKKNIILCIDRLFTPSYGGSDFETLASVYNRTKAMEKEDFEMVFVGAKADARDEALREIPCHEMPWYICPVNGTDSTELEKLMSMVGQGPGVLVGFGEDGRVRSCQTTHAVTLDAKRKHSPILQFSLDDTLYCNLEHVMRYDVFGDHEMVFFANPVYGKGIGRPKP